MHEFIEELYTLCEILEKDLTKTNEKLRMAGGEMTGADLEYVDKLTHAIKSIKTTMAMMEADDEYSNEGGSYGGSYRGGQGGNRGGSNRGGSNRGGSYGGSYARGRGRGARRDSMGRYSREGYSREAEDMVSQLRELMEDAPDEQTRMEIQRMVDRLGKM